MCLQGAVVLHLSTQVIMPKLILTAKLNLVVYSNRTVAIDEYTLILKTLWPSKLIHLLMPMWWYICNYVANTTFKLCM